MVFVPAASHVSREQEIARYDRHQNSSEDAGYRSFLSRVLPPLISRVSPDCKGLDYGSGPVPVLARILGEMGYHTDFFDPFFHDCQELLQIQYDFVTCTEVVEHFRKPRENWDQMVRLLKTSGWLVVMTQLVSENVDFGQWYYKMDETHICFYTDVTFEWVSSNYQLKLEKCEHSVFLLQR